MRRREFFSILGGAAVAWPLAAQAQQPDRTRRIAVLMPYGEGEISDSIRRAFEQALRDLSWINGRNIQIEYRLAGDDFGRLRSLAKKAVKLHPDVIVALNTPLVAAVLDETHSIPVVFGLVSDPVGTGFAQSYARPGGNATGFATAVAASRANGFNCSRKSRPRSPGSRSSSIPTPRPAAERIICNRSKLLLRRLRSRHSRHLFAIPTKSRGLSQDWKANRRAVLL